MIFLGDRLKWPPSSRTKIFVSSLLRNDKNANLTVSGSFTKIFLPTEIQGINELGDGRELS